MTDLAIAGMNMIPGHFADAPEMWIIVPCWAFAISFARRLAWEDGDGGIPTPI